MTDRTYRISRLVALLDVQVHAKDSEGPQSDLRVDSQLVDADGETVVTAVALVSDIDGWFNGTIAAPEELGVYSLRVTATDPVGGTPRQERAYAVQ